MSERMTQVREVLVEKLQYVDYFVEQLELTDTLSKYQAEEISCKQIPREKKGKLLGIIQMKGAYDIFTQCLRVSGQDELYQLMVDKVRIQPVTDELTTLQYRVLCQHGKGDPRKLQVPPHLLDRLEQHRETLQRMKNVERLVDLMKDEGCLTSEIARAIKEQTGDKENTNILIDHVKKSMLYSFFVLVLFLDISMQKDLMAEITEQDTKTALGRMDDLLRNVYYNLLGAIALKENELEGRLGIKVRDFVTLTINRDSKAVDRRGLNEAHADHSSGSGIELTELFSDQENNKPTRTVLLVGAPGVGKTTAVTQFAREATKKRTPHVLRPPFVIQLCSVDWTTETSLKRLLLRNGPDLVEKEQANVWRALSGKETEITVILDGADEVPKGFFKSNPGRVAGADMIAHPKDILNNLISGKLLAGAHVFVSSRPFGLEEGWELFHRKVDVVGFDENSLKSFLNTQLPPQHRNEVLQFLDKQINIRALLLTPLYAASFVLLAESIQNPGDLLIRSRIELSLSLIDSLVKMQLRKTHKVMRLKDMNKHGSIVWKLCKLIAELLINEGAIKTEMTEEDLEEAEVTDKECVETGLFVKRDIVEDDVANSIFGAPHQSLLESLAAIGMEEPQIKKLVAENDGRYDLIIMYVVGIMAEERNKKMLSYIISKEDKKKDFTKLTQDVVSGVLGSKRMALPGGEEFCMRIVHESQQWSFISDLKRVMKTRWFTSDSSELLMAADQLVRRDPGDDTNNTLLRVRVNGIHNMKYCRRATALGHHDGKVTAADINENAEHLDNISSVSFWAGFTQETIGGVTEALSQLTNVEAVDFGGNDVGSSSSNESSVLGCLSSIPSLYYLRLADFDLTSGDVVAVTSSCPRLRHLDISDNRGVQGADVRSRELTGLSVAWCGLEGDELVEMVTSNGGTLEYFNAFDNFTVSSSTINAILTCCQRLVELYVLHGGGELVQALSKRCTGCLKHLWLSECDLSSSSSSYNQVNSSGLSDVLTRHQSITSLTLCRCHPFTSDFMHLLSSSMSAISIHLNSS